MWCEISSFLSPFTIFKLIQNKNCAKGQEIGIKEKIILTFVQNSKGDFIRTIATGERNQA